MAHRPRWQDLHIGIIAAVIVFVGAMLILVFARVGVLHGKKFTLFVTTDAARGVIRGTEVWLDGQLIGVVKGVAFRQPGVNPTDRLVLVLEVLESARPHIRQNTRVQIRGGTSFIGDQVVALRSGTTNARGVADGDTIHAGQQTDFESVASDAALASRQLPAIIGNVRLLMARLHTAEGSLGAFGVEGGGAQMEGVLASTGRLMNRLMGSRGTVALGYDSAGALRTQAQRIMAQADSIRALVTSNEHSLGRFRRDSTLVREVGRIRDELREVERLADSPQGTIGRARTDSAIARNVHRDLVAFDSLFLDLKKHPLRYIAF
jgi:phospholipid/cholesterol/gamma-HCH transport system substrate-binding protein